MAKKKKKGPTKSRSQTEAIQKQAAAEPIVNPKLKEALDRLSEQRTAANEAVVFDLVKDSRLLAPVQFPDSVQKSAGKIQIPNGTPLKFVLVQSSDGRSFFPVFTSMEEASKLRGEDNDELTFIARELKDYEKMLKKEGGSAAGVAMNPMTNNIVLSTDLVTKILHGEEEKKAQEEAMRSGKIPSGIQISYSEPSVYPTALVNAVYEKCRTLENISRVWLKKMQAAEASGFALFVEQDEDRPEERQLVNDTASELAKDVPVITLRADKRLLDTVIRDSVALYDRELEF